jgi:hydrogenase maturation protein HypF
LGPLELPLPERLQRPLLAVGGHLKTTVALAFEDRVVISPHIADMGTVRSEEVFAQVADDLQRLYGVKAQEVVCDAHPGYATSAWARRCGLPLTRVWHHHAHAASLAAQHASRPPLLVFAWDGAGLGEDGTLWGGEAFLGEPGEWRRVASLRSFRPPGGDLAARAPWRSAACLCWELGIEPPGLPVLPLVRAAWEARVNCPRTSSAGRLLDAASSLVLGLHETSHEGQGPMRLEALATTALEMTGDVARRALEEPHALPAQPDPGGVIRIDWAPLVLMLLDARLSAGERAWRAHAMLAATIGEIAVEQRRLNGVQHVGLTGGVFQNALLTCLAQARLARAGFTVLLAGEVPCNDGGLSHGQVIERLARQRSCQPGSGEA